MTDKDKVRRLRRRRIMRETHRTLHSKIVGFTHRDVVLLAELCARLRRERTMPRALSLIDLLGSMLRALTSREPIRVGGVLYVHKDEMVKP